jgi:predicted ArsR family transcriptional regulator
MSNGRTKVTPDQVLSYLTEGKRTIKDVAAKFQVTSATARKHVFGLVGFGTVKPVGTVEKSGKRGRSPNLYQAQ